MPDHQQQLMKTGHGQKGKEKKKQEIFSSKILKERSGAAANDTVIKRVT